MSRLRNARSMRVEKAKATVMEFVENINHSAIPGEILRASVSGKASEQDRRAGKGRIWQPVPGRHGHSLLQQVRGETADKKDTEHHG